VSDVVDLLEVPALRQRFGIAEGQLPLLQRWIAAARIRWGLHAEHRHSLDLPAGMEQNSWAFGLRRMLLGYAVGAGELWDGIAPMDEIGGLDAALLGPLVRLLDALEAHWRLLAAPAAPAEWSRRLRGLLHGFFEADDGSDERFTLLRLESALQEWEEACADAALAQPLPLAVVREHWLARMEQGGLNQPFFAGGVTFASLMPMRAIPFRWIALLGMNDGDYPRSRVTMDFDLMGQDYRPGDRSRREDDRYLFLEALLSAREHLHVSWVGRSIRDNEERPPSVLVAPLRDHIAAGWGGSEVVAALTVEHRLQPFHPSYFDGGSPRHFSYANEWRAVIPATAGTQGVQEGAQAPLPPLTRNTSLTLRLLSQFLKDPIRAFFQQRLAVRFDEDDPVSKDQEPFAFDGLENWQLQDGLIQAQKAAVDAGADREAALQAQLRRLAAQGELPLGDFAGGARQALVEPMEKLFREYGEALRSWPQPLPDAPLDYLPPAADASLRLEDWLGGLRDDGHGQRARLVLESSGLVALNRWRYDRLLPHWVTHVAGHLQGEALATVVVSKAGTARLAPLTPEAARDYWDRLLDAWEQGMRQPLQFSVQPAAAWLRKREMDAAQTAYDEQRERNPYLARAFARFDALLADEGLEHWAEALLRPLVDALGAPPKGEGEGAAA
jgi:exodeoxyribonuclease V gamma subunit